MESDGKGRDRAVALPVWEDTRSAAPTVLPNSASLPADPCPALSIYLMPHSSRNLSRSFGVKLILS